MPVLQLKISPPQAPETHGQLAEALTRLTTQLLGKNHKVTAVLIDEPPAGRWRINGQVPQAATFYLDISITAGTNSAAEKAAYIDAVYGELQRQIGGGQPLDPASYVAVRELPATDWGYGGLTQQGRRLAREAIGAAA